MTLLLGRDKNKSTEFTSCTQEPMLKEGMLQAACKYAYLLIEAQNQSLSPLPGKNLTFCVHAFRNMMQLWVDGKCVK